MGRNKSPVKTNLINECHRLGIHAKNTDTCLTMIKRLRKHETRSRYATPPKNTVKTTAAKLKPNAINTIHSSIDTPLVLSYTAQQFVDDHYNGVTSMAGPEWKIGSNGKVKLMIPAFRNSKTGGIVRWILFK